MRIRIGTAENGGTFHSQGMALKVALEAGLFEAVDIVETPGASIENARFLGAGELQFGFMAANWVGLAQRGEPPFDAPIDLRVAAPMNAGPIFFIARADSPMYGIGELRGRRVAIGAEGSGMVQHAHSILDAIGLGFDEITPVYLDFAAGAEALIAGDVDAQIQCPIPNQVMTDLAERIAVRPLFYRMNELQLVLDRVPHYRATVLPAGSIRGLLDPMPQVAVTNLLMTHAQTDAGAVRELVRGIVGRAAVLAAACPLFAGLGEQFEPLRLRGAPALIFDGVPLHEAALAAYRAARLVA
jgi:TRAP transporter TAXI family solute receptor